VAFIAVMGTIEAEKCERKKRRGIVTKKNQKK
jgi:hypothetical protein